MNGKLVYAACCSGEIVTTPSVKIVGKQIAPCCTKPHLHSAGYYTTWRASGLTAVLGSKVPKMRETWKRNLLQGSALLLSTGALWKHWIPLFSSWSPKIITKYTIPFLFKFAFKVSISFAWGKWRHSYNLPINSSFNSRFGLCGFVNLAIFPAPFYILLCPHSVSKHFLVSCPNTPERMALCDCHNVIKSHFI